MFRARVKLAQSEPCRSVCRVHLDRLLKVRVDARAISVCFSEQCVGEQVVDDGNFRVSLQRLLVKPGARLILSGRDARHPQAGVALRKLRV